MSLPVISMIRFLDFMISSMLNIEDDASQSEQADMTNSTDSVDFVALYDSMISSAFSTIRFLDFMIASMLNIEADVCQPEEADESDPSAQLNSTTIDASSDSTISPKITFIGMIQFLDVTISSMLNIEDDVSLPGNAAVSDALCDSVTDSRWFNRVTSRLISSHIPSSSGFVTADQVDITDVIDNNHKQHSRPVLYESQTERHGAFDGAKIDNQHLLAFPKQLAAANAEVEEEPCELHQACSQLQKCTDLTQQQGHERDRQHRAITHAHEHAHQAELARAEHEYASTALKWLQSVT